MKGNPFFGTMRGKLGEQVFMRTGGEQRARTYLKTISNPRTKAQQAQRVKLANLVGFYRLMRPILGDSFLLRASNLSSYNAFVKANLASSRVYLTKEQAQSGYVVTAPYTITDGNLQSSCWRFSGSILTNFTSATSPFLGTCVKEPYDVQLQFKSAYLNYYSDADESDVLLFVWIDEGVNRIAPTMKIDALYISELNGSNALFSELITQNKPAEIGRETAYDINFGNDRSLAIVRARMSNNRLVVCSRESLYLGNKAGLRLGQFNTTLQLNSAINSYGMSVGFAIQKAVRERPMGEQVGSMWLMEDGTTADSIRFDKPADVNNENCKVRLYGIPVPADGFGKTYLRFENEEMNGSGTKITMYERIYPSGMTNVVDVRFWEMVVASGFESYPVTTKIRVQFESKDGSEILVDMLTPEITFNAAQ